MGLTEGAWSETALVAIAYYGNGAESSNDKQFAALTETIDIDMGDKDIDQIVSVSGGRKVKKVPQDITTITFECYPVDIDMKGGTGVSQMFHDEEANWDSSEPMDQSATRNREMYRIAILWTDDTTATTAHSTTAATTNAYRIIFVHAYCTSCKTSFTDGVLKVTLSFKVPAFNPNGIANIREQSGDATALVALNTYNSTNYDPLKASAYTW